jgi:hypothetical protein
MRPGRMLAHSPRAFPVGDEPPLGTHQVKGKYRRPARVRRARPRICLRKGCGCRYQPRVWNQRYCQKPECRRLVRRWQAARRQARRRQDPQVKAQHAQAERARRQRAKIASQTDQSPPLTSSRGHADDAFFPLPYVTGRAATNRLQARPATRRTIVALPAGRRFETFVIANASGSLAAPWMVGRSAPLSTRPTAAAAARGIPARRQSQHRGHRPTERSPTARRSSIIAWPWKA